MQEEKTQQEVEAEVRAKNDVPEIVDPGAEGICISCE
jgi:hypothetical protein